MKVNGEAVYGTKASPWGLLIGAVVTKKETKNGTTLYFSVFNWPLTEITVPGLKNGVSSATVLATGTKLRTAGSGLGLTIILLLKRLIL